MPTRSLASVTRELSKAPAFARADSLFLMAPQGVDTVSSVFGRTRLRTLILLRWIAVAGQTATVLFVAFVLGFAMPLALCLGLIAASAWLNVFLRFSYPPQHLTTPAEATWQLAFDQVQLAALVTLTGGLSNPFLFLLVTPVMVAAVTLRWEHAMGLAALAVVLLMGMVVFSLPLPAPVPGAYDLPPLLQAGYGTALGVGLVFFAVSAMRVSQDQARLARALDAAEVVVSREQRLSALGALSALTAHELGTPLATIHLVAGEMLASLPPDSPLREDVSLLRSQAERCRQILRQLAQEREAGDILHAQLPLGLLLNEAVAPHKGSRVRVVTRLEAEDADDASAPPDIRRSPEILHALGAFIENAISFAASEVQVIGRWSDDQISVTVRDDGPGFSPSVLPRLGEPYVTDRSEAHEGGGDMGLGFFIAKTLIERSGGRLSTRNASPPRKGAVIVCSWPREVLELKETL